MESQQHGHHLEDKVKNSGEFGDPPNQTYTHAWDIPKGHSHWSNGKPVQIKAVQETSKHVYLGSAQVNFKRDEDFEMLLLSHKQKDSEHKEMGQITRLEFSASSWKKLMGNLSSSDLNEFCDFVSSVPEGEQRWANQKAKEKKKELMKKCNPVVDIQAKIDSKSQRRVQMAIRKEDLIKAADRCEIIESGGSLGDLSVPYEFESSRRHRHSPQGTQVESGSPQAESDSNKD